MKPWLRLLLASAVGWLGSVLTILVISRSLEAVPLGAITFCCALPALVLHALLTWRHPCGRWRRLPIWLSVCGALAWLLLALGEMIVNDSGSSDGGAELGATLATGLLGGLGAAMAVLLGTRTRSGIGCSGAP